MDRWGERVDTELSHDDADFEKDEPQLSARLADAAQVLLWRACEHVHALVEQAPAQVLVCGARPDRGERRVPIHAQSTDPAALLGSSGR